MSFYPAIPNDWLRQQQKGFRDQIAAGREFIGVEVQQNTDPTFPIPTCYGIVRLEGQIVWMSTKSNDANILYVVVALCEGQAGPIYRVYLDGTFVPFPTSADPLPHNVPTLPNVFSKYYPGTAETDKLATFEFIDGRAGNISSNLLKEVYEGSTQAPVRYANMCYLVVKLRFRANVFNDLPKITVDMYGTKTYNASNWNGSDWGATLVNSYNPADHLLDYLLNRRYGAGVPASLIDGASFKTVRDYITTTKVKQLPTDTGYDLYMACSTLDPTRGVVGNINEIKDPYGLILHYTNGKYRLSIEKKETSYTDITDSQIVGDFQISKGNQDTRYNSVNLGFIDFTNGSITRTITDPLPNPFTVNTYIAQDGNYPRELKVSYTSVGFIWQARQIARKLLLKSRTQNVFRFRLVKEAWQFTVGDVLRVTTAVPSLTNALMRIISMKVNDDFTVDIEAVTHDDAFYPPFTDIGPEFGGYILFPGTTAQTVPITQPPNSSLPAPSQGDAGSQAAPGAPILPPITVTMNNVTSNANFYGTSGTTAPWPTLTGNTDFYLGRLYLQRYLFGGNTVEQYDGRNAPTRTRLDWIPVNYTTNNNWGFLKKLDQVSGTQYGLVTNKTYTLQIVPTITYRRPLSTVASRNDPDNGKYKQQPYLPFVYTIAVDANGNTTKFGWVNTIGNGIVETYECDLQVSRQVTIYTTFQSKPQVVDYFSILDRMPRLVWQPSPYTAYGGGVYGHIDNRDARTHVQVMVSNVLAANTPGIRANLPDDIGYRIIGTNARGAQRNIQFKIFSIANVVGLPEYLGQCACTNRLEAYDKTEVDGTNFGTLSATTYRLVPLPGTLPTA